MQKRKSFLIISATIATICLKAFAEAASAVADV